MSPPVEPRTNATEMHMQQQHILGFVFAASLAATFGCEPRQGAQSAESAKPGETKEGVVTLGGKTCQVVEVIDDCEDNNNQVTTAGNRSGYIYTYVDEAGSTITPQAGSLGGGAFTMSAGGANGSKYAARMNGTVASAATVYVGMGFNFLEPKGGYDASAYDGLSFNIRKAPGTTARARLKVPDANTDPEGPKGKICTECYNDFGADMSLNDEWTQWFIPWSSMTQMPHWGNPRPPAIDPTTLTAIQIQVADKGQTFDVWVDDLAFIKCQ